MTNHIVIAVPVQISTVRFLGFFSQNHTAFYFSLHFSPKLLAASHYFAESLLLHPGLVPSELIVIGSKKHKRVRVFLAYSRMIISAARPLSITDTTLGS